jgi:hypothetical protein
MNDSMMENAVQPASNLRGQWLSTALVVLLMVMALAHLASVLGLIGHALTAIAPGENAKLESWRRFTIACLVAAVGAGAIALRGGPLWRQWLLRVLSGVIALAGFVTEPRILGNHGRMSSFVLADVLACAVVAASIASFARSEKASLDESSDSDEAVRLWFGAALISATVFGAALIAGASWVASVQFTLPLSLVLWLVALWGSRTEPTRLLAAIATTIGASMAAFLALLTLLPLPYGGTFGLVFLRTPYGITFYVLGVVCAWLYLGAGARLRPAIAPARDRWLAYAAGVPLLLVWWYVTVLLLAKAGMIEM